MSVRGLAGKLEEEFELLEKTSSANIINMNQNQYVEVYLQLTLEFQSKIDEKLMNPDAKLEAKEKTFLEKVKTGLTKVKDYTSLTLLIVATAKELGVTVEQIAKLLGGH